MTYNGKDPIFCDGEKVYSGQTVADSQHIDATYNGIGYTIEMETSFNSNSNHTNSVSITEVFLFGERLMKFTTNNEGSGLTQVN